MAEAAAAIEDIAHDDLCPVCTSSGYDRACLLILVDLPIATIHTREDTMQPSPLRLMHGPVGGGIIHDQHRQHRDLELRRRFGHL